MCVKVQTQVRSGTVKVLPCRRALKLEMKRRRSDDGLVTPSLLVCNERMGGGVGHKVRAYGVNSGCATVYVCGPASGLAPHHVPPRVTVISTPWRTSRLHKSTHPPPTPHIHLLSCTFICHAALHSTLPLILSIDMLCATTLGTLKQAPAFTSYFFHVYSPQRSSPGAHCRAVLNK